MRILVTGSQGGIGRHLVARLIERGHCVVSFDVVPGGDITGDLRDYPTVLAAAEGCDAVAHLGAIPGPVAGKEDAVLASNAQGTWNVLLACVAHGIRRAVCYSSVNAFGCFGVERTAPYLPGDDQTPPDTRNPYQLAKHLVEEIAEHFARVHAMTVLCPRPVYCPQPSAYAHFNQWDPTTPPSRSALSEFFSYVDVRDVCEATVAALEKDITGYASFLLAADDTTVGVPTAELVERFYGDVSWIQDKKAWLARGTHTGLIDCRVAKTLLGWQPRHSWRDAQG
ncbi:MAG: NAD-dependent epimerase/dehydratase family protein [Armatimonadaceae bacterium]